MPHVTEESVINAVLTGIKKSHKEYFKGTHGIFISYGPEYVITTSILRELWKDGIIAIPESNLREAMWDSGAKLKGKFKDFITDHARCDIVVYSDSGAPIGAIEVKKQTYNNGAQEKDFLRLKELIVPKSGASSSFRYGISAFYVARDTVRNGNGEDSGRAKVEKSLNQVKDWAKSISDSDMTFKLYGGKIGLEPWNNFWSNNKGECAWSAACLVFKKKANQA